MRGGGRGHRDPVRHVVVRLVTRPLVGVLARVRGELRPDELQVVGVVAVRVRDAAVPARQSGAGLDRGAQSRGLRGLDRGHGHGLHDEVGLGECRGIRVHLRRLLDAHREAVLLEERDEQLGRLDWLVAVPAAAHDEGAPRRRVRCGCHCNCSWFNP
jgi:hypothetical protein